MPQPSSHPAPAWRPLEAIAAWLVPGLGHLLLGQRRRGLILLTTIGSLWFSGLLMGGITCIDRANQPFWFIGQALVAPSIGVHFYYVHQLLPLPSPEPGKNPPFQPALGRVAEQAILYTALAGLLNLLAIIDVLYHSPRAGASPSAAPGASP